MEPYKAIKPQTRSAAVSVAIGLASAAASFVILLAFTNDQVLALLLALMVGVLAGCLTPERIGLRN